MLIKKLSTVAALSGFVIFASPLVADDTAALKDLLMKQQKQIEALQKKVEKQETVHNEAVTHYIKNEIDRALEARGSNLLSLGSHVENLTIKGDLRVRYEFSDNDQGNSRDRWRQRFRLGLLWKTSEGWEIGAGLATGEESSVTSGSAGATSTNDTYSSSSPFESGEIFLDYAYAKHNWDNGLSLTLGQHKNPYKNAGLIWDSDVRFVGATVGFKDKDSGFFVTGGGYAVQVFDGYTGDNEDATLAALQVGITNSGFTAALSYYHFNETAAEEVAGTITDNHVNMASAYLEYAGKTDSFKYKVFGEYTINLAADNDGLSQVILNGGVGPQLDPEDNDTAWALGGEVGVSDFTFNYKYGYFEADSAFGPLTDADFATAVSDNKNSNNAEGHVFGIGYKVTKNCQVSATYILTEEIESGAGDGDEGELLQLNVVYKF